MCCDAALLVASVTENSAMNLDADFEETIGCFECKTSKVILFYSDTAF